MPISAYVEVLISVGGGGKDDQRHMYLWLFPLNCFIPIFSLFVMNNWHSANSFGSVFVRLHDDTSFSISVDKRYSTNNGLTLKNVELKSNSAASRVTYSIKKISFRRLWQLKFEHKKLCTSNRLPADLRSLALDAIEFSVFEYRRGHAILQ